MKTGKRYPWIDVLYSIGIILVIFGHSHPSDWSVFSGTFFEKLIIFIYTFHMPLFFLRCRIFVYEFQCNCKKWIWKVDQR